MSLEVTDVGGLHTLLKVLSIRPHWGFTENIRMSPKKVSIVVHWRRGTPVIQDGPLDSSPPYSQWNESLNL